MNTKIFKVIQRNTYIETGSNTVDVKVFSSKELAQQYLKQQIAFSKQDVEPEDMHKYKEEQNENYYERYLDSRSFEDSVCIWLEEDNICDELELSKNDENEYEI